MMDIGKQFRTDKEKEVSGAWLPIQGSSFLIARANSRAYRISLAKALEANAEALKADTQESEDLDNALLAGVLAETILLDWKDVKVDGKVMKYSKKLAKDLMTQLPDFCDMIRACATNMENFRADREEDQVKK